jgi:ABC-type multidrug transport system fused ATPase/permease subunit
MQLAINLYKSFFMSELKLSIFIILLSILSSLFKVNVMSNITAKIIESIKNNKVDVSYNLFYYFIIVYVIYLILINLYKLSEKYFKIKIKEYFRKNLIKYLLELNNENFKDINFIKFASPMFRFCNSSFFIFNSIYNTLLPNITILFVVLVYFLYYSPLLALIFLIGNVFIIIYFYYKSKIFLQNGIKHEEITNIIETYILETLTSIDKIIFRGMIDDEINTINKKSNYIFNYSYNYYKNLLHENIIVNIILFITIFTCLYKLITLYYSKSISSTIFITFITILLLYKDYLVSTLNDMYSIIEMISRTIYMPNIFESNDLNTNIILNKPLLNYDNIRFENISFKYNNTNNYIYKNFNLNIKTDNIIGIIGLSGNGKSTFAKLLIKAYKYDGNIYIDNVNINDINTNYLRKNILYVNQNSKLFNKNMMNNILYGCNNIDQCQKDIEEFLKYPKIKELYKNIDFKNKSCGLGGENLSGGQRQVINIINGLINPSKIIILDEPTNALDQELKKEIIDIIKYFKKNKKCIIIISHDTDIMKIFDDVIKIEKIN